MKRIKFLIVFVLLFIPSTVLGYGIENYYMNATVLENGDLEVEEYFELNGSYNGMERIIKYENDDSVDFDPNSSSYGGSSLHNGDGISVLEVRSVDKNSSFNFQNISGTIFNRVSVANKGDFGIYTLHEYTYGDFIKIFLPSNKNKAFYVKYKLHNMAILHNDIGELGWNIFGKEMNESIGNLVAYINVPNNKDIMKAWAHGPLNGNVEIVSKNTVKVSITGLNSNVAIDARLAFDKESISSSTKKTSVDALDKIINYENNLIEENKRRKVLQEKNNIEYIETKLKELKTLSSRETYNQILQRIYQLNNKEKQKEYLSLIKTYEDKINNYEYNRFKSYIDGKVTKDNYTKAKDIIKNVYNIDISNKMNLELELYYKKLIKKEIRNEIFLIIISTGTVIISLVAYKNRFIKSKIAPKYMREIPGNLSPAEVGTLVDKNINKNEITASILDLIRRKQILVKKLDDNSYDFILNVDYDDLNKSDKNIISLLFKNKRSKKINTKKMETIEYKRYKKFSESIINNLVSKKLIKKEKDEPTLIIIFLISFLLLLFAFVTFNFELLAISILLAIVGLFIYFINKFYKKFYICLFILLDLSLYLITYYINHCIFHISIIFTTLSIIIIIIILNKLYIKELNFKYTEKGINELNKWYAFRNFLVDFSKISEREIPDIKLWEEYLVYATALGISEKLIKSMKMTIEDYNLNYGDKMIILNNFNTIYKESSKISNKTSTYSSSSGGGYSSGGGSSSGGGGSFSGGSSSGGSFGGGGGGGRF